MSRRRLAIIASALAGATSLAAIAAPGALAGPPTVKAARSSYGTILVDGRGLTLYLFTRDERGPSRCAGACARAWPPLIVRGTLAAGPGAAAAKLGTVRRRDGRLQATYGGRPLYRYVGDRRAGQILCQNVVEFGGRWLILRPSGRAVR